MADISLQYTDVQYIVLTVIIRCYGKAATGLPSMLDFLLMLDVNLTVIDWTHPRSNKFVMGVENKVTHNLNDSPCDHNTSLGTNEPPLLPVGWFIVTCNLWHSYSVFLILTVGGKGVVRVPKKKVICFMKVLVTPLSKKARNCLSWGSLIFYNSKSES